MKPPFDFAEPATRRAWTKALLAPMDEAKWNELAWELFAWQYTRVPAYQRLCRGHNITPEKFKSWKDIPAVPQQLFKREKLYAHSPAEPTAIYETSGTTTGQPGRQHLLSTDIYRAVSVEGARRAGLLANPLVAAVGPTADCQPEYGSYLKSNPQLHFLTPSPKEAPHSSLSAMFGFWQKASGQTGQHFWMHTGVPESGRDADDQKVVPPFKTNAPASFDFPKLRKTLEKEIEASRPLGLSGTAFSFVHLIDAWADFPPLRLPSGSWVLETGGFKGRSREVSKAELYREIGKIFSVPDDAIWNEYGMSELSSQAYAHGTNGLHQTPPWARVLVVDPATNREVRVGQKGLVCWIDLANVDSVLAVQTLDVAERRADGFRLIGRMARTEPRGCSLSIEDLAPRTEPATSEM